MARVIKTTFKFRRGQSSSWTALNPILADGEPGYELDTHKLKIGDGVTLWNDLPYINSNSGSEDKGIPSELIKTLFSKEEF